MAKKQNIAWLDVETTGINAQQEKLLQVALRITDHNLNFIDGDGFERKVFFTADQVAQLKQAATEYVVNMHTVTGLWDALPVEGVSLDQIQTELMEHLTRYIPDARTARLGGNSITLDRNFLDVNQPKVLEHLHYRSYDVTTIAGMVEMFSPANQMYHKTPSHEAMDDITESVNEFRHYRDLLFGDGTQEALIVQKARAETEKRVRAEIAEQVRKSNPGDRKTRQLAEAIKTPNK